MQRKEYISWLANSPLPKAMYDKTVLQPVEPRTMSDYEDAVLKWFKWTESYYKSVYWIKDNKEDLPVGKMATILERVKETEKAIDFIYEEVDNKLSKRLEAVNSVENQIDRLTEIVNADRSVINKRINDTNDKIDKRNENTDAMINKEIETINTNMRQNAANTAKKIASLESSVDGGLSEVKSALYLKADNVHKHTISDITDASDIIKPIVEQLDQTEKDIKKELKNIYRKDETYSKQQIIEKLNDVAVLWRWDSNVARWGSAWQVLTKRSSIDFDTYWAYWWGGWWASRWGITWTLSDQTDLQTALNGKSNTWHTHTSSDITDFNESVEDIIWTKIVAWTNVTVSYNDWTWETTINASWWGGGGAPTDASYITIGTNGTLTDERVLTAWSLIDITDWWAGWNITVDVDLSEATSVAPDMLDTIAMTDVSASNINAKATLLDVMFEYHKWMPRYGFYFYTDFFNETSTTASDNWLSETNSWTWAVATNTSASASQNQIWMVRLATGTTATGRIVLSSIADCVRLWWWEWYYETDIKIDTLSTSSERYAAMFWFFDTYTAVNQIDAVYFLYDEWWVTTGSTASANWQIVTCSNSTRTFTTTSTAVNNTNYVKLWIAINAAWTSVEFFVDWTSVWTITTNIPTGTNRQMWFWLGMIKSVWLTSLFTYCDYVNVVSKRTTTR